MKISVSVCVHFLVYRTTVFFWGHFYTSRVQTKNKSNAWYSCLLKEIYRQQVEISKSDDGLTLFNHLYGLIFVRRPIREVGVSITR